MVTCLERELNECCKSDCLKITWPHWNPVVFLDGHVVDSWFAQASLAIAKSVKNFILETDFGGLNKIEKVLTWQAAS